jgi:hypothetical protein
MRRLEEVTIKGLELVFEPPPNFDAIVKVFPHVADRRQPIFYCYGTKVYNPSGSKIPLELCAHEAVHAMQQVDIGGPEEWWKRYLADKAFRFQQELEAHRVEYEQYCLIHNRHFRRSYIKTCANRLAGPLYGNMATTKEARRLILEASNGS